VLSVKGDYEGAEEFYRRALAGREKALGADHPDTLDSLNNLGTLLKTKGDYERAEELLRRALAVQDKALFTDLPSTLDILNNLGNLLKTKGDYKGAEVLFCRADAIRYNVAITECLSGNIREAKFHIAEYLTIHPEMKDQTLADPSFNLIKDYIETL